MTTAQQRRLYFPTWQLAARNHGWHKPARWTRVPFFGTPDLNTIYQRICAIAEERSRAQTSSETSHPPTPDDFRHACHLIAFGKDLSSSALTNKQLDLILALFRLLADPDDLGATLAWNNPQEEQRKRLLWWLKNKCVESYIVAVCREKFATDDWESLDFEDLRKLHLTLKNRPSAQRPQSRAREQASEPYINANREPAPETEPF